MTDTNDRVCKSPKAVDLTTIFLCILLVINYFFKVTLLSREVEWGLIALMAIIIYLTERYDRHSLFLLFYLLFYSAFTALSIAVNKNGDFSNVFSGFVFLPFVLLLFREKLSYKIVRKVFYSLNFSLIILLTVFRSQMLILEVGRNNISALALTSYFVWLVSAVENREENKIFPAIVVFVVCFLGIGRAGILSSTFLLVMNILFYRGTVGTAFPKIKKMITISFVVIILTTAVYSLLMPALQNLQARQINSIRTEFWKEYYQQAMLSPANLLLGAPLNENQSMLASGNWHLHNSFLGLHAKSGLVMFILVLVLLINSGIYLLRNKQFILLIFLVTIVFRASLDYVFFNSSADFIIYFYMFLPFMRRKLMGF